MRKLDLKDTCNELLNVTRAAKMSRNEELFTTELFVLNSLISKPSKVMFAEICWFLTWQQSGLVYKSVCLKKMGFYW